MRFRLVSPLLLAVALAACAPGPTPSPEGTATPTPAPPASVLASPSAPSPSPTAAAAAITWVGDPITVAEAIARRDGHLDETEIAIAGWTWRPALVVSCALLRIADESPARASCNDLLTWLSDVEPPPQGPAGFSPPPQPALQLLLRPDTYGQIPSPPQPARVIVMGHFDDHRASDCPPAQVADCRRNFIVDAILDPAAPSLDRSAIDGRQIEPGVQPIASPAEAVTAATGIPPGTDRILVASPIPGAAVASYEPKAATIDALTSAETVWLIRYLARTDNKPVVKTALVIDGPPDSLAANVFAVTPEAIVKQ